MSIRILIKDHPHRTIALTTSSHVLTFRHSHSSTDPGNGLRSVSQTSLGPGGNTGGGNGGASGGPKCMVEFASSEAVDVHEYRSLSSLPVHGTLGLITVQNDVFLCVVSGASKVASVRPGEMVLRILAVEFHCLNRSDYDHMLNDEVNSYPTDALDEDGFDHAYAPGRHQGVLEHPCLALKKLLSSGTFYYSADFDLTRRLQDRSFDANTIALDSIEGGFLWNSYMIRPLVDFRSRLSEREKAALDSSRILTSAIRGFVLTITVPASSAPIHSNRSSFPSTLTLISRLSCRRAGTRFNARGIDDDGNVANFVESETVFWIPPGLCFSYAQVRGSVPVFWEQATGLLPGQQKITVTRSPEATQPAFDRHFEGLEHSYGPVHVVNLLSNDKPGELDLSKRYWQHVNRSSLNNQGKGKGDSTDHGLLRLTDYDFHAETRGPAGYEAASAIRRYIQDSAEGFAYSLTEDVDEHAKSDQGHDRVFRRATVVLQQEGVFRTNCLDCLDRTNLVQTIISKMALDAFLEHRAERGNADFWVRHSTLWADNGDALSRIYAGTGALKSSFTRHGKMSFAGALADARKSATRMYMNNFADKGRQITIDMLLGRQMGQTPVHLYDPINDYVMAELNRRAREYSSSDVIHILAGTFNLNGRMHGIKEDLSPWLCPPVAAAQQNPEIVAVGFQEIVELSPQQIMSTDPDRRQKWEEAVKRTLNENAQKHGSEEYVILRGGQLVGASLSIFVKASVLKHIKNVEGSLKKTGLSGMAGNKGAVAIRMDFANTSLCFVTAHLAAGFANYEERNRDYRTISQGLKFQRNMMIDDHDTVVWLGDFNYRIGLSDDKVRKLVHLGDLETLYENDQLNLQMVAGLTFPYYSEARITFQPTYKYDNGTDRYDTSEKQRIPAWCDRVLRKGDNLRQMAYATAPLRFSDHRPVYATFECRVSIVDEVRKDELSNAIYAQRRVAVGSGTASAGADVDDTEDEDLIGYDSIEPGLPPASSDRRKWWLDNGLPARSTVQPPSKNHIPNPSRPPNPFSPTTESDWVHVSKPKPAPPPSRSVTSASRSGTPNVTTSTTTGTSDLGTTDGASSPRRRLPPPLVPSPSSPPAPLSQQPNRFNHSHPVPTRSDSATSMRSTQSTSTTNESFPTRKPARPPVPKKPAALLSPSSTGGSPASGSASVGASTLSLLTDGAASPPNAPPPRRAAATGMGPRPVKKPLPKGVPDLPPRKPGAGRGDGASRERGSGVGGDAGLLDDKDDEDMKGLSGWEVLRPS